MKSTLVLIVLSVCCAVFSCNLVDKNESIIGKWRGKYDNYSYEFNVDSLMNFQLIQHETNYNIGGKLELNNNEIELSMHDELYNIKLHDNFSTLRILPKGEGMKKEILIVCLVDFKK